MGISRAVVCLGLLLTILLVADVNGQKDDLVNNLNTLLENEAATKEWLNKMEEKQKLKDNQSPELIKALELKKEVMEELPAGYSKIEVGQKHSYSGTVGEQLHFLISADWESTWTVENLTPGLEIGDEQLYHFEHKDVDDLFLITILIVDQGRESFRLVLRKDDDPTMLSTVEVQITTSYALRQKIAAMSKKRIIDNLRPNQFYFRTANITRSVFVGQKLVYMWDGKEVAATGTSPASTWTYDEEDSSEYIRTSQVQKLWHTQEFVLDLFSITLVPTKPGDSEVVVVKYDGNQYTTAVKTIKLEVTQGSVYLLDASHTEETLHVTYNQETSIYLDCSSPEGSEDEDEWLVDLFETSGFLTTTIPMKSTDYAEVNHKPQDKLDVTAMGENTLLLKLKHIRIRDGHILGTRSINVVVAESPSE